MSNSTLQIEAIQTVMPTKQTDPRKSLRLKFDPQNFTIFHNHFNIVLFYNKAFDEDSGWLVAGWIKESLGKALEEEPLLAGRLKRDEGTGLDEVQIVSNDSGVRLIEARMDMNLDDFLGLKAKADVEAKLVSWEDVVEKNLQFSPMFYVQVTNFSCGGYSIGISCSLLVADPFALTIFLNKWTKIHKTIVSRNDNVSKIPIFYLPNFGRPSASSSNLLMVSNQDKTCVAQSLIFKILDNNHNIFYKDLANVCIDKAEKKIGTKMASNFSLLVREGSEDVKVEVCSKLLGKEDMDGLRIIEKMTWEDELGLEKIRFNEGNKPFYVSCWNNSVPGEDCVIIIPSNDEGMKIIVLFT